MKKKIIGIFFCILFLFSTYPVVTRADFDNKIIEPLLKTKDTDYISRDTGLLFYYGRIVNNKGYYDTYYGWCYNITPINARYLQFYGGSYPERDFHFKMGKINENPLYIPKKYFHGFISENHMFFWAMLFI